MIKTDKIRRFIARAQLGYPSGGSGGDEDFARLSLQDRRSHTHLFEIRFSLDSWAKLLASRGEQDVKVEMYPCDMIGATHEVKKERVFVEGRVPYLKDSAERVAFARVALARFEVDGWRGYTDDLFNHHKLVGAMGSEGATYEVSFTRWTRDGRPAFSQLGELLRSAVEDCIIDEATMLTLIAYENGELTNAVD